MCVEFHSNRRYGVRSGKPLTRARNDGTSADRCDTRTNTGRFSHTDTLRV